MSSPHGQIGGWRFGECHKHDSAALRHLSYRGPDCPTKCELTGGRQGASIDTAIACKLSNRGLALGMKSDVHFCASMGGFEAGNIQQTQAQTLDHDLIRSSCERPGLLCEQRCASTADTNGHQNPVNTSHIPPSGGYTPVHLSASHALDPATHQAHPAAAVSQERVSSLSTSCRPCELLAPGAAAGEPPSPPCCAVPAWAHRGRPGLPASPVDE